MYNSQYTKANGPWTSEKDQGSMKNSGVDSELTSSNNFRQSQTLPQLPIGSEPMQRGNGSNLRAETADTSYTSISNYANQAPQMERSIQMGDGPQMPNTDRMPVDQYTESMNGLPLPDNSYLLWGQPPPSSYFAGPGFQGYGSNINYGNGTCNGLPTSQTQTQYQHPAYSQYEYSPPTYVQRQSHVDAVIQEYQQQSVIQQQQRGTQTSPWDLNSERELRASPWNTSRNNLEHRHLPNLFGFGRPQRSTNIHTQTQTQPQHSIPLLANNPPATTSTTTNTSNEHLPPIFPITIPSTQSHDTIRHPRLISTLSATTWAKIHANLDAKSTGRFGTMFTNFCNMQKLPENIEEITKEPLELMTELPGDPYGQPSECWLNGSSVKEKINGSNWVSGGIDRDGGENGEDGSDSLLEPGDDVLVDVSSFRNSGSGSWSNDLDFEINVQNDVEESTAIFGMAEIGNSGPGCQEHFNGLQEL